MCGRFVIKGTWREYVDALGVIRQQDAGINFPARYNIAPTQDVYFLSQLDNEICVKQGRWWLVPHWAKDMPKYPTFNARSETAHEKSSFREPFKHTRCLIPADGYYEWTKAADGKKDPHCIILPDWEPFVFAGLWSYNQHLDITSCTILTAATPPDIAISNIHNRVPIILDRHHYEAWLDPETGVEAAQAMIVDHRARELTSFRVGRGVGNTRAEGPELIEAI